ncbi:OPT superfamily oligopeptide transporter [Trematosphaeria pertusa]|uniref:OPT superfamily oligopeptide transporter n=1 Tax=Trematosphaeria pertusa TaxID=390896 RepID=A0A6A6HSJ0_9PLEO|nr:OPT superfamily oligopeptide transporter [Trematosphaeria pertusa]KAF2240748.1 OPT superfamily oligopeptide transporter [Trematosphaeria pertusa]
MKGRSFTLRAIMSGLLIGLLINVSNTYYGLRVGSGSGMSMVSALMGFTGFRLFSRYTTTRFGAAENVLLVSVATATGCMPFTAGLIGAIPALEFLIGPDENGPLREGFGSLLVWTVGLCFFGIVFAAMLRGHFIERERLPWPGASATAHLINTLHHSAPKSQSASRNGLSSRRESLIGEPPLACVQGDEISDEIEWKSAMNSLLRGAIVSGIISVTLDFIPILHELPLFGHQAASTWLWTVDLSPGFFGQGMIIGPYISLHMLAGAIIGWGILSPHAKRRGWAPGPVDDWTSGSRGWIIWISIASLLADASIKLAWLVVRPCWREYRANIRSASRLAAFWRNRARRRSPPPPFENQYMPIPSEPHSDSDPIPTQRMQWTTLVRKRWESIPSSGGLSALPVLSLGFLVSLLICILTVQLVFGKLTPWYYTPLAIALSLPMAAVGIRSLAKTDVNPESAIVSQFVFAALISHSDPNAVIINLISAAIAVAGAVQSGDLAYDLKVGSIVGARPEAQMHGQIIGSLFGAFVSCGVYKLYASQYPIPGRFFRVPSAYLVLSTSRLLLGQGLPEGVWPFAVAAAALSALATILKMRYESRWWQKLIPSGVSFAIGIYLLPSFSITRALGGLFYSAYTQRRKDREGNLIILASGLVLGESIASLVNLGLSALNVPKLWV